MRGWAGTGTGCVLRDGHAEGAASAALLSCQLPALASAASSSLPSDPAMKCCSAVPASSPLALSSCLRAAGAARRAAAGWAQQALHYLRRGEPRLRLTAFDPTHCAPSSPGGLTSGHSGRRPRWRPAAAQQPQQAGAARAGAHGMLARRRSPLRLALARARAPARGCSCSQRAVRAAGLPALNASLAAGAPSHPAAGAVPSLELQQAGRPMQGQPVWRQEAAPHSRNASSSVAPGTVARRSSWACGAAGGSATRLGGSGVAPSGKAKTTPSSMAAAAGLPGVLRAGKGCAAGGRLQGVGARAREWTGAGRRRRQRRCWIPTRPLGCFAHMRTARQGGAPGMAGARNKAQLALGL